MIPTRRAHRMSRPIRHFLAGLALCCVIAASGTIDHTPSGTGWIAGVAHARLLEPEAPVDRQLAPFLVPTGHADVRVYVQQQAMSLISLALAFSTVLAFNLWIARHVRRVHALYRRRRQ